ncbi:hypothetical protein BKA70DRAFT_474964 [Coprinopsis sp. MPI-PUGE-AT-0042]|nr:hypothetical protein BKA70DRAFT_474964 [Coprinopsis sp. MPI-PUGE-AT-0042]
MYLTRRHAADSQMCACAGLCFPRPPFPRVHMASIKHRPPPTCANARLIHSSRRRSRAAKQTQQALCFYFRALPIVPQCPLVPRSGCCLACPTYLPGCLRPVSIFRNAFRFALSEFSRARPSVSLVKSATIHNLPPDQPRSRSKGAVKQLRCISPSKTLKLVEFRSDGSRRTVASPVQSRFLESCMETKQILKSKFPEICSGRQCVLEMHMLQPRTDFTTGRRSNPTCISVSHGCFPSPLPR